MGKKLTFYLLLGILNVFPLPLLAQFDDTTGWTREQKQVYQSMTTLFEAMKNGNRDIIASLFESPEHTVMKVINHPEEGQPEIAYRTVSSFIDAAGRKHEQVWEERAWDTIISIDGNMAQLWTHYAFFLGGTLSHCGVNAIQFYKTGNTTWKIIDLSYTRRTQPCEVPDRVKKGT